MGRQSFALTSFVLITCLVPTRGGYQGEHEQDVDQTCQQDEDCPHAFSAIQQKLSIAKADRRVDLANTQSVGDGAKQFNIVLIRLPKTASTTTSGVTRRIAAHRNMNGVFSEVAWPSTTAKLDSRFSTVPEPFVWANHNALDAADYGADPLEISAYNKYEGPVPSIAEISALKLPTFLWTVVRDPASRALSSFYYKMRKFPELNTSDASLKVGWLEKDSPNLEFRYTRPFADSTLDDIFATYGVVGVMERLDESLVVLAATLKVPLSNVLYLAGKEAGVKNPENVTILAHPSMAEEPKEVQDFLHNDFKPANKVDYELYERANRTLNDKIAQMKLEPAIKEFKALVAQVQEDCDVPGQEQNPINVLTECYHADHGCNYKCLDKFDAASLASCKWCD